MSMLTPPGLGGKYRITGDTYPRMRRPHRRRRIVLVAVSAVLVLGLAGWGTLQLIDVFSGDSKQKPATAKADCKPTNRPARALPHPDQITVNVYNATTRTGLAQKTADELKKRGFVIGTVDNAPAQYDGKVRGSAILLGPRAAQNGPFAVLGTQISGASVKTDGRRTQDVDFVIGDAFTSLTVPKQAAVALADLSKPVVKAGCGDTSNPAAKGAAGSTRGTAPAGGSKAAATR